jgi:hypothetical protein
VVSTWYLQSFEAEPNFKKCPILLAIPAGLEPATPGLGMWVPRCCAVLDSPAMHGIVGEKRDGARPPSYPVPAHLASSLADWVQHWVQKKELHHALALNWRPRLSFPQAKHDDQVDSIIQTLSHQMSGYDGSLMWVTGK